MPPKSPYLVPPPPYWISSNPPFSIVMITPSISKTPSNLCLPIRRQTKWPPIASKMKVCWVSEKMKEGLNYWKSDKKESLDRFPSFRRQWNISIFWTIGLYSEGKGSSITILWAMRSWGSRKWGEWLVGISSETESWSVMNKARFSWSTLGRREWVRNLKEIRLCKELKVWEVVWGLSVFLVMM